jgi:hypothetical protein
MATDFNIYIYTIDLSLNETRSIIHSKVRKVPVYYWFTEHPVLLLAIIFFPCPPVCLLVICKCWAAILF